PDAGRRPAAAHAPFLGHLPPPGRPLLPGCDPLRSLAPWRRPSIARREPGTVPGLCCLHRAALPGLLLRHRLEAGPRMAQRRQGYLPRPPRRVVHHPLRHPPARLPRYPPLPHLLLSLAGNARPRAALPALLGPLAAPDRHQPVRDVPPGTGPDHGA